MSNKKSEKFVKDIIAAASTADAVGVLNSIVKDLYIGSSYINLVQLKDKLVLKENIFHAITDTYRSLDSPKSYEDIHEIRVELGFLYRDISDELTFEINRQKIYFEERKTVQRAQSSLNLKKDEEFQENFKKLSENLVRDYIGWDKSYDEWTSCYSTAYGLYKNLESLLTSIRMLLDSLASEEKRALLIIQQDVK